MQAQPATWGHLREKLRRIPYFPLIVCLLFCISFYSCTQTEIQTVLTCPEAAHHLPDSLFNPDKYRLLIRPESWCLQYLKLGGRCHMALLPVDILASDQTLIPIDKINLRDTLVWVFSESFQESQNKIWYWPAKGSSTRRAIDEQSLLRPEQVRIELIPGQALEALNIGQSAGCLLPMAVVQKSKLKWEATNVHLNWRWYTKASNPTRQ